MKIVLANRYFHPDQSATSRMVSSLAFALAERGFSVTALACRHFHDTSDIVLPAREAINGVSVHRLWTSGFGRRGMMNRAGDYATFHLSAMAWFLLHARARDLCVVCTDPPLLGVSAAAPLAIRGARLVNWIMDLFPETAVELGVLSRGGGLDRFATSLRDAALKRSDLTICPIHSMANYLEQRGTIPRKLATVHHWSDEKEIRPIHPEDNPLREEWKLKEKFIVGYSGNFGRAHEFATLLDTAEKLRGYDDIRFLLIGDGQQRAFTELEVQRRGLTNVLFKQYQPAERLAQSLSVADVHIVSLLPALEYCIVPSKFYGVLAAGRPTIFVGDQQGEVASVSRRAHCGEAVAPGDSTAMAAIIMRLRGSSVRRSRMGENARQLLESEYMLRHGVDRWQAAVSHLLPKVALASLSPLPGKAAL
ncbi:glycosyltransferase family 4 protein [Chelativorans sp. YIM 93263]|uniref:glycosyltransferase family 4 protein n=1 Tax=Chelativorans sp. YIM 93263 TaxID=2906648 RepID=UPI0023796908|nr:glycosyltransferase family 4 protein [Chelativorans sp. YIM 93263]